MDCAFWEAGVGFISCLFGYLAPVAIVPANYSSFTKTEWRLGENNLFLRKLSVFYAIISNIDVNLITIM
jgi:hypothetical protein